MPMSHRRCLFSTYGVHRMRYFEANGASRRWYKVDRSPTKLHNSKLIGSGHRGEREVPTRRTVPVSCSMKPCFELRCSVLLYPLQHILAKIIPHTYLEVPWRAYRDRCMQAPKFVWWTPSIYGRRIEDLILLVRWPYWAVKSITVDANQWNKDIVSFLQRVKLASRLSYTRRNAKHPHSLTSASYKFVRSIDTLRTEASIRKPTFLWESLTRSGACFS